MQERKLIGMDGADATIATPAVVAGGFVFVSATGPVGPGGQVGADIAAQTRQALDRLGAVLAAAGSSLAQAVARDRVSARRQRLRRDERGLPRGVQRQAADADDGGAPICRAGILIMMSAIAVPERRATRGDASGRLDEITAALLLHRARPPGSCSLRVSSAGAARTIRSCPGPVSMQTQTILDNAGVLLEDGRADVRPTSCRRACS